MNIENIQKLSLEWQEELNKEKQRKIQAQAVLNEANTKINMIEGGLQFAEMLVKNFGQTGNVDIGTKASRPQRKPKASQ
tara:strand:+ start:811 stop:1047 length:237 start_codon:yes stop_codon:yes gene_type:complete